MKLFKKAVPAYTKVDFSVLTGGIALFSIICGLLVDRSSIWFDEAFGAYLIRFNFWDIARYTAGDVHPPLYYWLLKVWGGWFGYSEVGLRSMSIIFGVIALVFAFLLVRRYFGRRVAWTGLAFMSVTPFFVRYGVEMRMYTMVAALAFAATYVLTLADRSKKTWQWVLYGALVGFGMLTHYFIALVWLTHWLWRLVVHRSSGIRGKRLLREFFSRGWIIAHAVALAVFSPWIGAFVYQIADVQGNGFWIPPITPATPINFLTSVFYYLQVDKVESWGAVLFSAFVAVIVSLIAVVVRRGLKGEQKNYYLLVTLLAFVPPSLLLLLSLPPLHPAFVDRYVVPSALSIGLLIGVSIGLSRPLVSRRIWWAVAVGSFIVFAYGLTNVYRLGNYNLTLNQSNNTRELVQAVRAQTPNEPIIADSPWLYYEAAFYSTAASPVYFIDANTQYRYGSLLMLKENDLGKIKNLSEFETSQPEFWYIGRPGADETRLSGANLSIIGTLRINDSVSGAAAYEAVHYRVL